ncbi:ankyrin repeat domain-containing protein [Puniceicoccaceae bacterium K14]|nr:ankyrin repeat domain-containing protein [Puniceicoccaceae bacterium K14]
MNRKLSRLFLFIIVATLSLQCLKSEETVYLNLLDKKQEIDGFGACFIAYDQMPAYRDPMFYDLAVYDLGLSILRAPLKDIAVVNSDLEIDQKLIDKSEYARMILKEFKAREISTFLATSWTPPGEYKTNLSELYGGYLNPDYREKYAHWMIKNARAIEKSDGIKISALSIQNELMFIEPYGSCLFSPIQLRETFRTFSKVFQQENINTKIVIPEEMGWYDRVRQYIDTVMLDEETSKFPFLLATHGWSGDYNWKRMGTLPEQYNRKLWMTENSGHPQNWDGAMAVAADIHRTLVNGNVSGYLYWQLNSRVPDIGSLMTAGRHAPKSIAMKHYARYARPGSHRIHTFTSQENLKVSSFSHAEEETLTVVLLNETNAPLETTLKIVGSNQKKARFNLYTSDQNESFRNSIVTVKDTITVPARGIVTLYGRLDGKLNLIAPLAPPNISLNNEAPLYSIEKESGNQDEQLHYAARANQPEKIRQLIAEGYNPDMPNVGGFAPLHRSAWPGHIEAIDPLIEGGANPNPIDAHGETPLHIASSNGHESYVRHLASRGADIDFPDTLNGQTPLHNACRGGNIQTVRTLLEIGAEANKTDNRGWTALFFAGASHSPASNAIFKILLENGADAKYAANNSQTALHVVASNLHSPGGKYTNLPAEKLQVLIEAGADVNVQDNLGRTALHYVCQIGHWGYKELPGRSPVIEQYEVALQLLLELGADPEIEDNSGMKPIEYAKQEGYLNSVSVLENFAKVQNPSESQEDAYSLEQNKQLLRAVKVNDIKLATQLLNDGADPNYKEKQGGTSLHYAIQSGNPELVTLILQKGARKDIRDSDGYLPTERAQQINRVDLLEILSEVQ